MSDVIASRTDSGNSPINIKRLNLGWIIGFLFVVSFIGLFSIMSLRKMMIQKYKLTYSSGTVTAYLINSFYTPKGEKLAKKQVSSLFKSFGFSFLFGLFQWFFTAGGSCGFVNFPTFGIQAFAKKFYFDFSSTYVGVGMICTYMVNISLLVGAIVSWGIMWAWVASKEGNWYAKDLDSKSLHGLQGYKVFLAIAMILGDGLFQFVFMIIVTVQGLILEKRKGNTSSSIENYEDSNDFPNSFAIGGYIV